uniref:Guanine nucleotide-binding protein subunit beta-like protein 1 n=1 Tax=Geotrypetes seraphini TaxID=260995 RepID=A0A6P8RWH1_GEOSA|nr:guanine nucleotide-binding protein subunit beta-like protein 1 [Geotrypetes seraphini]XP_033809857.1 guanine nucleotide-binding protein subunit beta-like protein 1 [Geotrypetes seraphini]XP_033809858.1 guanine nucleotide-binding protein subunit beta-like protein 1 [Geotrypetes seraphini]XP_033809859.1 guanine nucleotide-binding protein subunit beta-like protein 1 [Geotrypetes seraphini]
MALPPPDPKFVLRGPSAEVAFLHFYSTDQDQSCPVLFSGSSNGLIHLWNLKTRRTGMILDGHGGKSLCWLQTLYGRDTLLSQGRDLQICIWDLAEGRNTVTDSISMESVGFCKCSLLKNGHGNWLLAMPGQETSEIQVLDLPSKKLVCTLKPEANAKLGMPMCLKLWQPISGSCPLLLCGYEDGSVILWNTLETKALCRHVCHQEPVMSLDFDSDKARGVSGSAEKVLSFWSLDEQQILKVHKTHQLVNSGIAHVAIRPDKKILATAGWDHRVRLFGWKTLKPLAVLHYHTAAVHCVAFSHHSEPSERLLAAGSKDHRISLWSIY